jgi:ABC-type multidrug transport system fused ATPase/permease subunit
VFSGETVTEALDATEAPKLERSLLLDHVSFGYPGASPVLRDVCLRVQAGERVCIVGPTGVGKTTLLNLLLRLYDPDRGSIAIDGVDIRRCSLSSLRARITYVPQDPWLLDGTLAENIAFGRTGASDDDIRTAAREALVDEFVERLADGYDTPIGEAGVFLSGGQRRRIAIARAILRDADLLLLDEPTSGLDPHSAAGVMAAMHRAAVGRTVIVVTHQLDLAIESERVVVFENGHVVQDGAPVDLLTDEQGPFSRLWRAGDNERRSPRLSDLAYTNEGR